jgi:hypothetical protein
MSMDEPYISPESMEPYPPRRGMSGGARVLIVLGVVFLVLIVLCCAGAIVLFFYLKESTSDDPVVVRQVTAKIVQIDIPEELQPAFSLDMKVPFSDRTFMVAAFYADKASQSILVLAMPGEALTGRNQEQLRVQIDQSLRQQGLGPDEKLRRLDYGEKEIQVRGQPVKFGFATVEEVESGKKRREVTGVFQGENGPVMFIMLVDPEVFDDERITGIIESIR